MGLGRVALLRGDVETGRAYLEESLAIRRRERETWGLAQVLNSLGDLARRQGDYERARALYEEGLEHFRLLGTRSPMAGLLHNLGYVSLYQREVTRAAEYFAEGLSLFREVGDKRGLAECLAGLAGVAAAEGEPLRAARLFGASEAIREASGFAPWFPDDDEQNVAHARHLLGADITTAWNEGRAMTLEDAVATALEMITEE
jgi:tetratricopeptide (TPR) repeat protein